MPKLIDRLTKKGFSLCSVCLLDSTFLFDDLKFVGGTLAALSFNLALGLPALTVLSKCDMVKDKEFLN